MVSCRECHVAKYEVKNLSVMAFLQDYDGDSCKIAKDIADSSFADPELFPASPKRCACQGINVSYCLYELVKHIRSRQTYSTWKLVRDHLIQAKAVSWAPRMGFAWIVKGGIHIQHCWIVLPNTHTQASIGGIGLAGQYISLMYALT